MNKSCFYVVTHKQAQMPEKKGYYPIVVGKNEVKYKRGFKDNTGDNISEKNSNYCELTALYWIWKNTLSDYICGFCHYRRFFTKNILGIFRKNVLDIIDAQNILDEYDIILPTPEVFHHISVKQQIIDTSVRENDLKELRNVILEIEPDYIKDYDMVMSGNKISCYNMFVMRKSLLDDYCAWLFNLFFQYEKKVDMTDYSDYEKRIYGFLSERLFNVWVKHNHINVKYLPVVQTEESVFQSMKRMIKKILRY